MSLTDIYEIINAKKIKFKRIDLLGEKAISVETTDGYAIGIDNKEIATDAEELVLIAHEMGHGETLSFYNPQNILDLWTKHEHKANVWAIKKLIPKDELESAVDSGYNEMWELAEYFNYPQAFVEMAVNYYHNIE